MRIYVKIINDIGHFLPQNRQVLEFKSHSELKNLKHLLCFAWNSTTEDTRPWCLFCSFVLAVLLLPELMSAFSSGLLSCQQNTVTAKLPLLGQIAPDKISYSILIKNHDFAPKCPNIAPSYWAGSPIKTFCWWLCRIHYNTNAHRSSKINSSRSSIANWCQEWGMDINLSKLVFNIY